MARRKGLDIDGVLLLDKPVDLSSNSALQCARHTLNARKAGHTGTLDPFATGLLVCCFGVCTKIAGQMLGADKSYRATLSLGSETDSGDLTGEVVQKSETDFVLDEKLLQNVLNDFTGQIQQVPPMHSALKRNGKPLYLYAREGIELEREPRTVTIYSIDCISADATQLVLDVACSKGTYIRTLAQDIGRALGCYAHLTALRRLSVGPFKLDDAITLDAFKTLEQPASQLISLGELPTQVLPEKLLKRINSHEPSAS